MKSQPLHIITKTFVIFFFVCTGTVALWRFTDDALRSSGGIEDDSLRIEHAKVSKQWPHSPADYCRNSFLFIRELNERGRTDLKLLHISLKVAAEALSKNVEPIKDERVKNLSRDYQLKCVDELIYINNSARTPTSFKIESAKVLVRYIGNLRKGIIEGYVEPLVVSNVMPPIGVINGVAGMDPLAISDHRLRAEYLRAIEANLKNAIENTNQYLLRRSLQIQGEAVLSFAVQIKDCHPETTKEIDAILETEGYSKGEIRTQ